MEEWVPIEDFPGYEVSDLGHIRNASTLRILGIYDNGHGVMQVVVRRDGRNHARAVHRLVANAFHGPEPRDYVPLHIDGDTNNNASDNLVWKPRWFALSQTRQRKRKDPVDNRKIHMLKTNEVFDNALECAKAIGGLEDMVLIAAQTANTTYMGSQFAFIRI